MNWDQVSGDWKQLSAKLKEKWGKLTDDDLTRIAGKRDRLVGILQERDGYETERVDTDLNRFIRVLTS